jgi:hypothetical protein
MAIANCVSLIGGPLDVPSIISSASLIYLPCGLSVVKDIARRRRATVTLSVQNS